MSLAMNRQTPPRRRATYQDGLDAPEHTVAEAEVAYLWMVDPLARTIEGFALADGTWTLRAALAGDAEVRVAPTDAVVFPLSALRTD